MLNPVACMMATSQWPQLLKDQSMICSKISMVSPVFAWNDQQRQPQFQRLMCKAHQQQKDALLLGIGHAVSPQQNSGDFCRVQTKLMALVLMDSTAIGWRFGCLLLCPNVSSTTMLALHVARPMVTKHRQFMPNTGVRSLPGSQP